MKPNLILVHSFPTNSILLGGLSEFLSDFFEVYFIDLPGFHNDVPAFSGNISMEKFSDYLDKKIQELNLSSYVIGGVSFGFLVVNNAKLDKRCLGVLAAEPFVGSKYLHIPVTKKIFYSIIISFLKLLTYLGLGSLIWTSRWFSQILRSKFGYPGDRVRTIIENFDAKTFFSVLGLLMGYDKPTVFKELPYFLIGNFDDKTIDFASVVSLFKNKINNLQVYSVPIDHYPKEVSKQYFKDRIPAEYIEEMIHSLK